MPTSPDALRERYERVQDEVGASVTIVVATKYVSLDDMAVLSDAGVTVVGENRAQAAKQALMQAGIPATRMRTISYGKERPFCTESTEACWQQNRRAHFVYSK